MLVVEELYKEAVVNTSRKLIVFNGELDRIRSGCILLYSIIDSFLLFFISMCDYASSTYNHSVLVHNND